MLVGPPLLAALGLGVMWKCMEGSKWWVELALMYFTAVVGVACLVWVLRSPAWIEEKFPLEPYEPVKIREVEEG
jgi:hypothetical protein